MTKVFEIGIVLLCLTTAPLWAADADKPDPKLRARIERLVKELGDDDYETRETAHAALLRIGRPALKAVEAATRDPDAERVRRAADLADRIRLLPDPAAVDRNCTNGYMPAHHLTRQVQTFTAAADADVDVLRVRTARTYGLPSPLEVAVYAGDEPRGKPLATVSRAPEWVKPNGDRTGVSRFMTWLDLKMTFKLEKGETYCAVFASPRSGRTSPWLVNCFYRDAYPGGKHTEQINGKAGAPGNYDLVLELRADGKTVLTTVPGKVKLKDKEHFGLGHNGVDLRPPEGKRSRTSGEAHPELHTSLDVIGRLRKLDMPGVVAYPVQ